MLIRFVLENIFSFGSRKEFNMIPNNRLKTLSNHRYEFQDFNVLKISSIYGANAAGKSNLIKAIYYFKQFITEEKTFYQLRSSEFKFYHKRKDQVLAVEFIEGNIPFYYGLKLNDGIVIKEELYKSGLGNKDELIYERNTDKHGKTSLKFNKSIEIDNKIKLLKDILIEEFVKPDVPILKLLSNRDNKQLINIKLAYNWFENTLRVILPDSKPLGLSNRLEVDQGFKDYAEKTLCSIDLGIVSLTIKKEELFDFFGKDSESKLTEVIKRVEESQDKMIGMFSKRGEELSVSKESGKFWVKRLMIHHKGKNNSIIPFELEEESDGTLRLLDFVPAFKDAIITSRVFFIDEIERSLHPLLIKELIQKFSELENTKGQIIFTTHESNLLDQSIFRQDEIWFAEKDNSGMTDLYSLSDYKEHKTTDIRKGYLNGRYGSIPFLGNLKDLNW